MEQKKFREVKQPIPFALSIMALLGCIAVDNDSFWIIALGRSIVQNGIPFTEPLSMHSEISYVAQQWLSSVLFYKIYDIFGYAGLTVLCFILSFIVIMLMRKFYSIIGKESKASYIMATIGAFLLLMVFGSLRPHLITYSLLLIELICLEKYSESSKWTYLIPIPIISLLEINLHASMWLMLFVFMAPYVAEWGFNACDNIIRRKTDNTMTKAFNVSSRDIKILPLGICAVASFIAGFANPYGFSMMTYLFRSYGVESINAAINEMQPLSWTTGKWAVVYIAFGVVAVCLGRKKMRISTICLFVGTVFLSITAVKGVAYVLAMGFAAVGYALSSEEKPEVTTEECVSEEAIKKSSPLVPPRYSLIMAIILSCVSVFVVITKEVNINEHTDIQASGMAAAVDYLEENYDVNEDTVIYGSYNTGGYLEFRGYKPYIDARAEVFIKENTGTEDIFSEAINAENNPYLCEELIEKYQFEYIFAEAGRAMQEYLSREEQSGYRFVKGFTIDGLVENNICLWVREQE